MTDDELLALVKRVDPQAVRLPPGIKAIAAEISTIERAACKARALEIIGWHRNSYNGAQIDPIVADIGNAL